MLTFLRTVVDTIDFVNRRRAGERFISNSSLLRISGGVSCMEPYQGAPRARPKSSDQMIGLPTKWSGTRLPTSLERFGLKALRRIWPRSLAAKSERPSDISVDNENGRATQSPRSWLKSSHVTKCETSKSVHGHSRRAF